jgi:hypothetical protein
LVEIVLIRKNQYDVLFNKAESERSMKVEIKGNELIITVEMQPPTPSASGKTLVIASSHGNQTTTAMVDGKPVVVGLNAYIKK